MSTDTKDKKRDDSARRWRVTVTSLIDSVDPLELFPKLRQALTVGDDRSEYSVLARVADQAAEQSMKAHDLAISARLVKTRVFLETDELLAKWRNTARQDLGGKVSEKAIEDWVRERFGDNYKDTMIERAEQEEAVNRAEALAKAWEMKDHTLRQLLKKITG
jgi:transposase-like protein